VKGVTFGLDDIYDDDADSKKKKYNPDRKER
jgi:hypothetical protein